MMHRKIAGVAAAAAIAALLGAGTVLAQPTLSPQGSGNVEMDHSRMGGSAQGQRPSGPARTQAPTLTPQGGSGNSEMDHSRMGGANMGSPSGGTITGNPGGGPEVRHGHESNLPPRRN